MLRIVAFDIDPVRGARHRRVVTVAQPFGEGREARNAFIAPGRPAALEQHDQARGASVEITDEFRAKRLYDRAVLVVEEMKVVEKARGLAHAQAKEGVDAAL